MKSERAISTGKRLVDVRPGLRLCEFFVPRSREQRNSASNTLVLDFAYINSSSRGVWICTRRVAAKVGVRQWGNMGAVSNVLNIGWGGATCARVSVAVSSIA